MFRFFNKENKKEIEDPLTKICALLVHAAKIDENFTDKEREIIKKAIIELGANDKIIDDILIEAEEIEKKSNQILSFTKEVKSMDEDSKTKIIEILWNIIYSDNNPDMYENSLMRRLTGLLYLNPKTVGDLKQKVISKLK
tara:strand:+ start:1124 stop:1543 length:420 start_codon:yes stop_codon:yes gene_type:complete